AQGHPAAFGRGGQAGFCQLHASGCGEQVVAVFAACDHVADELLPLCLEPVVQFGVLRNFQPLVAERLGGRQVRVPHRFGGLRTLLCHAAAQPCDGRAMRAVHLELHELVTVDAHCPGGVDLGDDVLTTRTGDLED